MGIAVHIPHILKDKAGNQEIITVTGSNVGQCLNALVKKFPGLHDDIFKNGKLQNHIEIYVNMQSTYPEELTMPVQQGDSIHITLMLSGG